MYDTIYDQFDDLEQRLRSDGARYPFTAHILTRCIPTLLDLFCISLGRRRRCIYEGPKSQANWSSAALV
jgi:hypothetical protein